MDEKEIFNKVFVDHLTNGQYYQLLDHSKAKNTFKSPKYSDWENLKTNFNITVGEVDSKLLNIQEEYYQKRVVPWEKYFDIMTKPLNGTGFDWLILLHPNNKKYEKLARIKIAKLCQAAQDICLNPISNPRIFFDSWNKHTNEPNPRIHPGKNMVSACQVLDIPVPCIRLSNKNNKTNYIKMKNTKKITTLNEVVDQYETIPLGFMEKFHIHTYCLHGNYTAYDRNGYQNFCSPDGRYLRKFDIEKFAKEIVKNFDSKEHFPIKLKDGKIINIPKVYDIEEIRKFFKHINKINCWTESVANFKGPGNASSTEELKVLDSERHYDETERVI